MPCHVTLPSDSESVSVATGGRLDSTESVVGNGQWSGGGSVVHFLLNQSVQLAHHVSPATLPPTLTEIARRPRHRGPAILRMPAARHCGRPSRPAAHEVARHVIARHVSPALPLILVAHQVSPAALPAHTLRLPAGYVSPGRPTAAYTEVARHVSPAALPPTLRLPATSLPPPYRPC